VTTNDPQSPGEFGRPDFTDQPQPGQVEQPGQYQQPGQYLEPGVPQYVPAGEASGPVPDPAQEGPERVGRGLLFALGGIVAGTVLALVLWNFGFIASISSFVMAAAAVWLYAKGAGTPPRKGLTAIIGLVALGVILTLFAFVAFDIYRYLMEAEPGLPASDVVEVIAANLFNPALWAEYAMSFGIFVLFAVLGVFGTLRRAR